MLVFVWARALCGTRIGCCASVDCSGTIRKIHVAEIHVDQGVAHACYHDGFRHLGTAQTPQGPAALRAGNPTPPSGLSTLLVSFERR